MNEVEKELNDVLQHYGVLGMKWGVRKDRSGSGGKKESRKTKSKKPKNKKDGVVKSIAKSKARELKTINEGRLKNLDKLSTKEIKARTKRLRLENELKRLSKTDSDVSSSKDHEQYLRRDKMSDRELNRKVDRLKAKSEFKQQVKNANKETIDIGKTIVSSAATFSAGYLIAKSPEISKKLKDLNTPQNIDNAFKVLGAFLK